MSDILGNEEPMETMEGGGLSLSSGKSFLNHMSTITESDKFNMMNMTQYALLAIIPIAVLIVVVFTLVISYALYKIVDMIMSIRVREDQEERGLDDSQHGELFS